ncbi:MAG: DUF4831 family protein [Bacteroidota bacterium]
MRKAALLFLTLLFLAGCSTIDVIPILSSTVPSKAGVIYALPKHEFDVVVDYEKVSTSGSKFLEDNSITDTEMEEALKHFRLRLPFTKQNEKVTSYKIKSIKVETRVVPDPEAFYYAQTYRRNHPFLKKTFLFELKKEGYLSQANASSEDYTVDFVLNTAVTAARVVAGITNPMNKVGNNQEERGAEEQKDTIPENILENTRLNPLYQLLKRYRELEDYKWELYQGRADLLSATMEVDISFVVKKIEEEQLEIAKLFVGKKKTKTARKVFPADPSNADQIVFRLHKSDGFGSGQVYQMKVTSYTNDTLNDFIDKQTSAVTHKKGLHYRIPATALVEIKNESETHYRGQHVVPQLGVISFLPDRVGMTKNDIKYTLDPTTGALLKYDANSEGVNLEAVKAFQESATEVPALFQKPDENEFEEIEKQIKQLELENMLLEQQIKKDSLSGTQGTGL